MKFHKLLILAILSMFCLAACNPAMGQSYNVDYQVDYQKSIYYDTELGVKMDKTSLERSDMSISIDYPQQTVTILNSGSADIHPFIGYSIIGDDQGQVIQFDRNIGDMYIRNFSSSNLRDYMVIEEGYGEAKMLILTPF